MEFNGLSVIATHLYIFRDHTFKIDCVSKKTTGFEKEIKTKSVRETWKVSETKNRMQWTSWQRKEKHKWKWIKKRRFIFLLKLCHEYRHTQNINARHIEQAWLMLSLWIGRLPFDFMRRFCESGFYSISISIVLFISLYRFFLFHFSIDRLPIRTTFT